jgi:hypothetical protein
VRLPVKPHRGAWPAIGPLARFVIADPRGIEHPEDRELHAQAVSTLKARGTTKWTEPNRHPQADAFIASRADASAVILDVGASDGTTALDLIHRLGARFSSYFVTDLVTTLEVGHDDRGRAYFREPGSDVQMVVTPRWVAYRDTAGAVPPLGAVARRLLRGAAHVRSWRRVDLAQPDLSELAARDPRVHLAAYDVFTPWAGPRPAVVKIANLLNRAYFTDERIRSALQIQSSNVSEGGVLVLVDNRPDERFTAFERRDGRMVRVTEHAGGCDVAELVPATAG